MASRQCTGMWRSRVERLLATDMGVTEWCKANRISDSSMFKWIGFFADTEPELFGGKQNIADRDSSKWIIRTRENMRATNAPIVPVGKGEAAGKGFVRIDVAPPAARGEAAPAPPAGAAITVSIGPAVVSVPAGSSPEDVACVLGAVSRL